MPRIDTEITGRAQQPRKPKRKKAPKVRPRVHVRPPDRQPGPKPKLAPKAATPDQDDRNRARLERGRTPDQADRSRSPRQQVRDRKTAARNIQVARETARARKIIKANGGVFPTKPGTKAREGGPTQEQIRYGARRIAELERKRASTAAPVVKVLEQTARPIHGIAGAADAAVRGENVGKAALRGVQNKDKKTFSDVLKSAGVKNKGVAGTVGFALDVGLDPTTYVTFGASSVGRKATVKAARDAEKKALKAGLTQEQAARMGERAAKQATQGADETKGVTIRFAGKEAPGVTRATAKASKPVRAAARKVTPKRARDGARAVGADVNPNVAPAGVSKKTARAAQQATRTARAKSNRGTHEAQQQALGIQQALGKTGYGKVIDAIEAEAKGARARRRARKGLTADEAQAMVRVRSQFRGVNRQRKQAGIRGGERRGYVPHHLTDEAVEALDKSPRKGTGRRVIVPSSSKARTEQRSLAELREEAPGRYSENLPELYAARKAEGATAAARAELNQRIADLGTPVRKGRDLALERGESVYHVVGSDLRRVTDKKEIARLVDEGGRKGRYVVLNDALVKRAIEGVQPTLVGPGIVRGLDKVQGGFKRVALATPGFHVRNLVGDTQNAYLGQSGHRIPRNMIQAGRVLKAQGRGDKALRDLKPGEAGKGTVNTPAYGRVTYDEIAKQLSRHGAMRSGYTARELPELSGGERATLRRVRLPKSLKNSLLNREDLPRVTTAIEALKQGATWEQAAQRVTDYHFDYADLTSFERNIARRAAPFWTFTARNIPLQFKSLAAKPGKFANYQKLIEEAQKAAGMDEEAQKHRALADQLRAAGVKLPDRWESLMSEWEQRNVGVPVSWRGKKFTVSFGLPLAQGLNAVPGAAGTKQVDEYFKVATSLVTPIIKNPAEYFNNYSAFFRDQIERDNSPLVSAPSYVAKLPESLRADLGIVRGLDKRTGKLIWRWPGKLDYIVKSVPGLPQYAQQLSTEGTNRRGKGTGGKVLQLFGVRAEPFDPERTLTNLAYERIGEIEKRQAALRQSVNPKNNLPVSADNPTREYTRLSEQLRVARRVAYQGQEGQDYKVLPKQGAPKKLKVKQGFDFGSGGEEFDFSGGAGADFDFGG